MRRLLILICLLLFSSSGLAAQQTVFKYVKIRRHRSADKRVLVDKIGALTFDDSARKLKFESDAGDHIEVEYDVVAKAVFEGTTHMRGGAISQVVQGVPYYFAGAVVGAAIASEHVSDHWLYLEYRNHDQKESVLIDVPKDSSAQLIDKANTLFGSRVTVADFSEKGSEIKLNDLKALESRQKVKVDKQNHPLPEVKPDRATVVVVCPPLAARFAGKGIAFRLHANDQVIAVNKMGTYSFAYLDPGKYELVSQAQNANGFEMSLEGGHEYFFLQNIFQNGLTPASTALSRNSPELVTYLLDGSYFSNWKTKEKKEKKEKMKSRPAHNAVF
jgi:hypothetical protein